VKKTYAKPTLLKAGKLGALAAGVSSKAP